MPANGRELAEKLREAIRASGRSLGELGRASGLDAPRLSRFMRGERDLSLEAYAAIAEQLRLKMDWIPLSPSSNESPRPAARKRPRKGSERDR